MVMKIQTVSVPGVCMMRRMQDFRRDGCLKNGEHVPAFSNSDVYRFLEQVPMCGLPPVGRARPERGE